MALVDLKSNLANFRADFPQEGKLKSPGNLPGSMPTDIQKKSPNNAPTQRYINDIKVERIIKPKPSPVNPIATTLKDKASNIVTIATVVKDKVSAISPIQTILKDKTSQVNPIKTELKGKVSTIAPIKSEVKDKSSQVNPIKSEVKDKVSTIAPIKSEVKDKSSNIAPIKSEVKDKTSPASIPGEVNFFNDVRGGAKGFATRATDRFNSNIIGVNSGLYDHGVAGAKAVLMSAFTTPTISTQHNEVKPKYNKNVLEIGTYKIDNQLGSMGSPFKYLKDGAIATKKFSDTGYSAKRRYNDSIKSVKGQSDKSLLYTKGMEKNSPSAIDAEYARYDLQEESFNPTYMKQPFVVRSIGRRWGFRTSPGAFDDGLISGGMTTAVERSALDTARIAKWMASPKGLLWVVKQIGLGLTNPKVEAIGGALTRQTRIHSGLASLLSVPTTAFGIHFTRHGVPFLNAAASYGNVIDTLSVGGNTTYSRLINLKSELLAKDIPGSPFKSQFVTNLIQKVGPLRKAIGFSGMPILSLSGLAGPGSVYGIGLTTIKRHYNSRNLPNDKIGAPAESTTSVINPSSLSKPYASDQTGFTSTAEKGGTHESKLKKIGDEFAKNTYTTTDDPKSKNPYWFKGRSKVGGEVSKESKDLANRKRYSDKQYAGGLRATTNHDFDANKDTNKNTSSGIDDLKKGTETKDSLKTSITNATKDNLTPGAKNNGNGIPDKYIETNAAKIVSYPNSPNNPINDYVTLAYNKIPKLDGTGRLIPNDFRNDINKANPKLTKEQKQFVGIHEDEKYFETNDIQNKAGYGLGSPGRLQKFKKTDPKLFIKKGNDFNFKSNKRNVLTSDGNFEGDMVTGLDIGPGDPMPAGYKDFIKFWFEDANSGTNVMAFRATLNGFTDSFSPGWDQIAIMGRPDSAYLYSSFERSISFNFTVAATTRSEMIPMWRKLNYLSTYTMPDLVGGSKPSGPMIRFTIGDLFYRTPGFITSLSYTIPDDATWDLAEADNAKEEVGKQLPMMMEVSISLTVIGDYRPQKMGRAYSLSPKGGVAAGVGNWLGDADTN